MMTDPPCEEATGMTHAAAAEILSRMHLTLVKASERIHRKRSRASSQKAVRLTERQQQPNALSLA